MLTTEQKQDIARMLNECVNNVDQKKIEAIANRNAEEAIRVFDKQIKTALSDNQVMQELSQGRVGYVAMKTIHNLLGESLREVVELINAKYPEFSASVYTRLEVLKYADIKTQKFFLASNDQEFIESFASALKNEFPDECEVKPQTKFGRPCKISEIFLKPYATFEFADGSTSPLVEKIYNVTTFDVE